MKLKTRIFFAYFSVPNYLREKFCILKKALFTFLELTLLELTLQYFTPTLLSHCKEHFLCKRQRNSTR
jgi:hypothetical protein